MLETERLILRPFTQTDVEAVFTMRSDAEIMHFIRAPQNRAESENWIKLVSSRWASHQLGFCAVIEKNSNKMIGWCGLWILNESGETEIGYAIDKQFWGKGYAPEAAEKMLDYGFENLKSEKIVAVAMPANTASRRVMEKLGMTFDGIGRFYNHDLVHYTITKNDYFRNRKTASSAHRA